MQMLKRGAGRLALAALLLSAGNGAGADELLVMPFACTMVGGRPLLSPAQEQSHRIVGQREQRTFNACSPVNPSMCRSWTVHRFVLECDGTRVPWVEVVAAAEAEQRSVRAWLKDGRLRLRMEAAWTLEPDDPCAQRPAWFDRGRMRRYCAERQATGPQPVVDMPAGFAPMLGIDGIFVKSGPGIGAPPPPPPIAAAPPGPPIAAVPPAALTPQPPGKIARTDPPQQPPPEPAPSGRTDPPRDAAAKEASAKTPPPPVAPAPSSQPAPKVAAPPPPPAAATPPAAKPGGPVIPKIINRPEPSAGAPASAPADAAKTPPPAPQPDAKSAASSPPAAKDAGRQEPPQPKTTAADQEQSITVNLLSVVRSPATAIAFAFAALAAALLTVFALARRRERANHAGRRPRDIAAVSLDGRGKRAKPPVARIGNARGKLPANAAAAAMHRVPMPGEGPAAGSGVPSRLGDRIPRTRSEALQVLGMGVAPSANDAALKKIVDGLRLSWHPDLAKDEADRQQRELRLKQINAAWEIIQGKRGEV